ncbi:hypothetical protein HID58_070833, partial [Brassica napus]
AQAGNICVAAFDSTCSGICKSTDPIVEASEDVALGAWVYWAWLYKAQAGNICVAAFDSTCSGICKSTDPIVEVNMQCVDLEIII